MNDTTLTDGLLVAADNDEADGKPADKRITGERNRTNVLAAISRFGWLTSKMVAAICWADAAQGLTMARRTLKALGDDKLVVARAVAGTPVFVLSARGARLLTEQTGKHAESGYALALGNPVHRAASNWFLIRALHQGMDVVTEHEIATGRGPCKVLHGKVADGLVIADDGLCTWVEVENAPKKSQAERAKTTALARVSLGNGLLTAIGPDLWLARLAIVGTNLPALRHVVASFQAAHHAQELRDSQLAEVDLHLLPVSASLVPGELEQLNLWWDVLAPDHE
jgi:hypothetical protein